jgi:hypothetical protein
VSIPAVAVNHNTTAYMELMLRSLYMQNPDLPLAVTIFGNDSDNDAAMRAMRAFAGRMDVPIVPSGFATRTEDNSHGETLRRFTLDPARATPDYLLFLEADVCFTEAGTIRRWLDALAAEPGAFGAGPRQSWDGVTEMPAHLAINPAIYENRFHPCCALVRNTPLFRRVVAAVGLSAVSYHWSERTEYWDTFGLMTAVMGTHGQRHVIADALVMHAFAVSYPNAWASPLLEKHRRRDDWLARFRAMDDGTSYLG